MSWKVLCLLRGLSYSSGISVADYQSRRSSAILIRQRQFVAETLPR